MTIEGGRVAHSDFHQLHIVKSGRIALFLATGFARVAIKELLLSGVPHCTPPIK